MATVAHEIKRGMPFAVVQLVMDPAFPGCDFVQLESDLSRPTSAEIAMNACFVKPVIRQFPDRVPSGFFITDVWLKLDKLLGGKALVPRDPQSTKQTLAAREATRTKKLIGALRYLWRSSFLA